MVSLLGRKLWDFFSLDWVTLDWVSRKESKKRASGPSTRSQVNAITHSPNMTDVWQVKSQNQMKLFPLNSHDAF